jgi:hypothetical protein
MISSYHMYVSMPRSVTVVITDTFLQRSPGTTDHSEGTPINEFTRDEAYYRALENLFDIFRHRTPVLHELRDISALVRLADKYDSLPSVSRAVRLHLMEYYGNTSELYRRIAREPVEYLCIGEKVRSSIIAKEAAIHVLGTWSETETLCRERISSRLFDSLVRIHRQLCQKKERANKMLLSLNYDPPIPLHLDPMGEAVASLIMVRENICNAFYNCLRQNTPERFEGELYRKIAGSTIISKPQLSSARRATSQISFEEGCARLKRKIDDALSDLADNYSRVNPTDVNARYLLCARLDDAGLSWDGEWE